MISPSTKLCCWFCFSLLLLLLLLDRHNNNRRHQGSPLDCPFLFPHYHHQHHHLQRQHRAWTQHGTVTIMVRVTVKDSARVLMSMPRFTRRRTRRRTVIPTATTLGESSGWPSFSRFFLAGAVAVIFTWCVTRGQCQRWFLVSLPYAYLQRWAASWKRVRRAGGPPLARHWGAASIASFWYFGSFKLPCIPGNIP